MTKEIMVIIVSAILADNLVLVRFLGVCPLLGTGSELRKTLSMGVCVCVVMTLAAAISWPVEKLLLEPHGMGFMQTVAFVLIIACLVQSLELLLKARFPGLSESFGVYLPLIATNCAVLGICEENMENSFGYAQSVTNAFASGVGFILALFLFSGVMSRIEESDIPESFRGLAITLAAAAIVSLSFAGFSGLADGLFGM